MAGGGGLTRVIVVHVVVVFIRVLEGDVQILHGRGGGMSLHGNLDLGMLHPIAYGGL